MTPITLRTAPSGGFPEDIPEIRKDIRDVSIHDLKAFDAVIHLAALSNDPLGDLNPVLTREINLQATLQLARLAREAGVGRFLFSSSCSIYGAAKNDDALDESSPLRPMSPYAESKIRAEKSLASLADSDFSPVLLRNATAYGYSPRLRADIVLNNLVGWAWTTGKVRVLSDGTPWRPLVHVEDISQAFLLVLQAERHLIHNQAINVGVDSGNYQVRDLADIVVKIVPNSEVSYGGAAADDPRNYRVRFGKLGRLFPGFLPRWDAEHGAQQLLDAYRDNDLQLEQFTGRKYIRLRQLNFLMATRSLNEQLRWRTPH